MTDEQRKKVDAFLCLFRIEGKPANEALTEGQKELFFNLVFQPTKRLIIVCSTQYGKSLVTALACIVLTCIKRELVAVVAPTNDKAKIIMRYYIEHIGDNALFYSKLEKNTKLERLRQEESKERIVLRDGGGIFSLSVNQRDFRRSIEAAMGMGAKNTIQDESCLIKDETEATIFRMIGGQGSDAFYCKIGNPFYKQRPFSHFYKSWRDPRYHKVFIDYKQGILEGRYTEEFIKEAKTKPKFNVLFECNFPKDDAVDARGYTPLVTDDDLDGAYVDKANLVGQLKMGVDVSGGGRNRSVMVVRGVNAAQIVYYARNEDTMALVGDTLKLAGEHGVYEVYADKVGIGKGYCDRLLEEAMELSVFPVNVGEKATEEGFANLRAEAYWKMMQWLQQGGKLVRHDGWEELLSIRYKTQSDKKMRIISKEEMAKENIESPDVADALMLTFVEGKRKDQVSSYTPRFREYQSRRFT